jgi:hypothetical protein
MMKNIDKALHSWFRTAWPFALDEVYQDGEDECQRK